MCSFISYLLAKALGFMMYIFRVILSVHQELLLFSLILKWVEIFVKFAISIQHEGWLRRIYTTYCFVNIIAAPFIEFSPKYASMFSST